MEIIKDNISISESGCWNWGKSFSSSGYGQQWYEGKYWNTHRLSYALTYGEIPEGMVIRHKCHNPRCCNPEHLEIGTHSDNWLDSECKHRASTALRRKKWSVGGIEYNTMREAVSKTGISFGSLSKYCEDGVFNIEEYRRGCEVSRVEPKI